MAIMKVACIAVIALMGFGLAGCHAHRPPATRPGFAQHSKADIDRAMAARTLREQPARDALLKQIAVPEGCKLLFQIHAEGVQIYKATKNQDGKLAWTFEGPLAWLENGHAGCHYEGPTWESTDGSRVVRDKSVEVKSAPAPDSNSDIPWLLVKVKAEDGVTGRFSPVVYVQRRDTSGGQPESVEGMKAPHHEGARIGVPYEATYYFYGKAE